MLRPLIIAAIAAGLGACATQDSAQSTADTRSCFRNADIMSYGVIDSTQVNVRTRGVQYVLTTAGDTHDLEWSRTITVRSPSGRICTGAAHGVEIVGGTPPRRLIVTDVRRVSESGAD